MKLTFDGIEDFMAFIPALINVAIQNDDFLDDETAAYFDDVSKKIKNVTRQYFVGNPELRLKLKRMLAGFENNQNVVLTIKPDKASNENREQKYLTEKWVPIDQTIKKHLNKGEECHTES